MTWKFSIFLSFSSTPQTEEIRSRRLCLVRPGYPGETAQETKSPPPRHNMTWCTNVSAQVLARPAACLCRLSNPAWTGTSHMLVNKTSPPKAVVSREPHLQSISSCRQWCHSCLPLPIGLGHLLDTKGTRPKRDNYVQALRPIQATEHIIRLDNKS